MICDSGESHNVRSDCNYASPVGPDGSEDCEFLRCRFDNPTTAVQENGTYGQSRRRHHLITRRLCCVWGAAKVEAPTRYRRGPNTWPVLTQQSGQAHFYASKSLRTVKARLSALSLNSLRLACPHETRSGIGSDNRIWTWRARQRAVLQVWLRFFPEMAVALTNVRFWHKAGITRPSSNVRFRGVKQTSPLMTQHHGLKTNLR